MEQLLHRCQVAMKGITEGWHSIYIPESDQSLLAKDGPMGCCVNPNPLLPGKVSLEALRDP